MKTDQIVMCVVALALGMLVVNMLTNVCGCKTRVEGFDFTNSQGTTWTNLCSVGSPCPARSNTQITPGPQGSLGDFSGPLSCGKNIPWCAPRMQWGRITDRNQLGVGSGKLISSEDAQPDDYTAFSGDECSRTQLTRIANSAGVINDWCNANTPPPPPPCGNNMSQETCNSATNSCTWCQLGSGDNSDPTCLPTDSGVACNVSCDGTDVRCDATNCLPNNRWDAGGTANPLTGFCE